MAKQTNNKQELVLEPTNDTANTEQVTDDVIVDIVKQWTVVKQFRDIKDFNLIHKVGDVVEHTQEREDNGLIELR